MKKFFLIIIGVSFLFGTDIFIDKSTGLEWQDNSAAKIIKQNWEGAKKYCQNLSLNGKKDWRLPIIQELQTIVDIKKYDPAVISGFKNVASSGYWSSENAENNSYAWSVLFDSGRTKSNYKSNEHYVRCVRAGQ